MFCTQCGNSNNASAKFCSSCGAVLLTVATNTNEARMMTGTEDQKDEFLKAVIGPKNQSYYLRHFQRFSRDNKLSASWHWPAFFLSFYWFLYRKMWLAALVYFLLPYALFIPVGLIAAIAGGSAGEAVTGLGYILYLLGVFVVLPLYANALYYRHCNKKIAEAKIVSKDPQRQLGELSAKGGTSGAALFVILLLPVIAIIGILAAIALPAYQDYTTRANMFQALTIGKSATAVVTEHYYQNQVLPDSLDSIGFAPVLPGSIQEVGYNNENGTISVVIARPPVAGQALLLVPSLDENHKIAWQCMSEDIPNKYLPADCRQEQ